MRDPYQVLGISSDVSDDDVKRAYRKLSKKYHPDANINAPNIEELTEKFKEVQNAYDTIMDMRKRGYTGDFSSYQQQQQSYYQNYGQSGYQYKQYTDFNDFFNDFFTGGQQFYGFNNGTGGDDLYYFQASSHIRQGYFKEALNDLEHVVSKDARWYYYSAICHNSLGNNIKAMEEIEMAIKMDPGNMTYQQAYRRMQSGRKAYQNRSRNYVYTNDSCVNCCFRIVLLNMCINCICGRGFFCCL